MPDYNYKCENEDCELIHEETHKMNEEPEIKCPECGSKCSKTFEGVKITTYTRGYGYCDKAGCTRDMNLYKLEKEDPYAQHRVSGEKDHIANKLRRGGRPPKNTKYFT